MVAVYMYRADVAGAGGTEDGVVHLPRDTAGELGAGRPACPAEHPGHQVAADLPSYGRALLVPLEQGASQRCGVLASVVGIDVSVTGGAGSGPRPRRPPAALPPGRLTPGARSGGPIDPWRPPLRAD